jgi:hypothetical protein
MINDPSGTAQVFIDDIIQRHLDANRMDVYFDPLVSIPRNIGGGTTVYYEFRSRHGDYETTDGGTATFYIQHGTGSTVGTASWASMDYQSGILMTTTNYQGTALYVTGRSYDLYGAAADLLDDWAQKVALQFDFSSDQQSFSRSQKQAMLKTAAEGYRQKARSHFARISCDDDAWPQRVSRFDEATY